MDKLIGVILGLTLVILGWSLRNTAADDCSFREQFYVSVNDPAFWFMVAGLAFVLNVVVQL